jgi:site-specific DNA-methyltransferase (adenine-specific)
MLQENMANKEERIHPTQKPVALAKWILSKYAKPGQIILDCFAGSGSFLVAAEHLGHPWIGIEKDADYCRMARERIARESQQLKMFTQRSAP